MNEMIKDFKQLKQSKPAVVHAAAIRACNKVIRRILRSHDLHPHPLMTKYIGAKMDENTPGFMRMDFDVAICEIRKGYVYKPETVWFTMQEYRDFSNARALLQHAEENELPF